MAQSFADWQLADVSVTPKGAKQCLLSDGAGKQPMIYAPDELLVVPFGYSSWEESTRKNLELRCTSGVEAFFLQLDDWARAYLVIQETTDAGAGGRELQESFAQKGRLSCAAPH